MKKFIKVIFILWVNCCLADDNRSFQNTSISTIPDLNAISCDKTATSCVAIGISENNNATFDRFAITTEDGGKTWSEAVKLGKVQNTSNYEDEIISSAITCDENAIKCIATHFISSDKISNPVIYKTYDGGRTWSNPEVLPVKIDNKSLSILKNSNINNISIQIKCDKSATNFVIAGTILTPKIFVPIILSSNDSGNTWISSDKLTKAKHAAPSDIIHGIGLFGLSCDETGKQCKAVGNTIARNSIYNDYYASLPVIYSSNDGGKKWGKPQILPTKIKGEKGDSLFGISCNHSGQKCTVGGITYEGREDKNIIFVFKTTDGGNHWGKKIKIKTIDPKEYPATITCDAENEQCVITGMSSSRKNSIVSYKAFYYLSNAKKSYWEKHVVNDYLNLLDISCNNDFEKCFAVGYLIK